MQPWGKFLGARAEMIHKLAAEGMSAVDIAGTLSMDPTQARLIAATPLASIVGTEAWHAERRGLETTPKPPPWLVWSAEAAEKLKEGTVAWLRIGSDVQRRPYVWIYDEELERCAWFTAAPDGEGSLDYREFARITHYLPISIPEAP